jgi:hypothetical protein
MMVQGVMTPPKTTLGRTDVMQRKADSMMEESDTRTSLAATERGRVVLHETPRRPRERGDLKPRFNAVGLLCGRPLGRSTASSLTNYRVDLITRMRGTWEGAWLASASRWFPILP